MFPNAVIETGEWAVGKEQSHWEGLCRRIARCRRWPTRDRILIGVVRIQRTLVTDAAVFPAVQRLSEESCVVIVMLGM